MTEAEKILQTLFHSYDARGNQLAFDEALAALSVLVEGCLPEKLVTNQTVPYLNKSVPPQPDDGPGSQDILNDEGKGYNQAIAEIRNNLKKVGL